MEDGVVGLKRVFATFFAALIFLFVFVSCTKNNTAAAGKPVIAVSILPQKYFIERIGGDRITALVLVGPGQDPHSWEPGPRQMASLAKASAWVLSGMDFEISLVPKVAAQFPALKITDGTAGVTFRHLQATEADSDESASGTNIDRHSWLGREPAKIMAGHIRDVLVQTDPEGKAVYDAHYTALVGDIDSVYNALDISLANLSGKTVLVFHPAFGYFLDEFHIRQESIETGGKEPTAQVLSALIVRAKAEKTPAIFVQAQFPEQAAKNVAEAVGARVVMLDPLAPDWLDNIRRIGDTLEKSLESAK
jgi:zinc transport system substrate-binding protein